VNKITKNKSDLKKVMISDKFVFYSRSRNAFPGKGVHEIVSNINDYTELKKIKNWRRMLSNFDTSCDFTWNGYRWRSIEHAFQSTKIGLENKDIAYMFTLDSGHTIGNIR
jgi:hypothetical protein